MASKRVETTTELEAALLQDAIDLLDSIHLYANAPTPANWNRVEAARQSLSDTTYGVLRG